MTRGFVDSNVFIYALGGDHPHREACRRLVTDLARGELAGEISTEVVQEVVHVRRRRAGSSGDAVRRGREILAWGLPIHDFTRADLELALMLAADQPRLPLRDAAHVATAQNRGIGVIVSTDRDFDSIDSIERVDPADEAALNRLRA